MTSRDFCYWLQGYFELTGDAPKLTPGQVKCIKDHLNMVFIHEIDPSFPPEQQPQLNDAHQGWGSNLKPQWPDEPGVRC